MIVTIVGETPSQVRAGLGRLAGCSLSHALQLPGQAALQPQGWLAGRCCAYQDCDGTLWVGVAVGGGGGAAPSLDEAREAEAAAARALLLACLTSHAVLWLVPADGLARGGDATLLRRLRLAQQLKAALLPGLQGLMGATGPQASALRPGLCIPQLLVLAAAAPAPLGWLQAAAGLDAGHAPKAAAAELEAQQAWAAEADRRLRALLKRCRVLQPEDSARALCTLPTTGPLLLLLPERLGSGSGQAEVVAAALAELSLPAAGQAAPGRAKAAASSATAAVAAALAPHRAAVAAGMAGQAGSAAELARSWRQAIATLAAVLEVAALKACGNPGAGAVGSSEAGASRQGQAAPDDVAVPPEAAAAAAWHEACSDGLRQFSLASCKRAAAVAAEAYRRNTPALLPAAGHAVALQAALRLYRSLARGPAAADGARALQEQLAAYWRDGHMQCDAVSFLGNPCCLPAHDPAEQAHSSAPGDGARPLLLPASGSGAQQHSIAEPFTVPELQRAAATVAAEGASAAARAQFFVRRLAGAECGPAGGAAGAAAGAAGAAGRVADLAEAPAAALLAEAEGDADAVGGRYNFSGAAGHSSGEEEEREGTSAALAGTRSPPSEAAAAAAAAAAAKAAVGLPAAGCWLELHVLGRRAEWKTAALAAALLLDGQPGWLRAGGCMFGVLPLLVAVPPKPGQVAQQQQQQHLLAAAQEEQAAAAEEEFPSLAEVQQKTQRRQQLRRQPTPKKQQKQQQQEAGADEKAQAFQPQLLGWPGWAPAEPALAAAQQGQRAPLFVAPGKQRLQTGRGKQRSGRPALGPAGQAGLGQQQQGAAEGSLSAEGPAAAAAAAVAEGRAVAQQATLLLGYEYESVQGQRLLLTPALLATAVQSSLDSVSVRQHAPPAAASAGPGPSTAATAAAAAAAAAASPAGPAGTAPFMLLQDLPLWLQLPGEQLAALAGKRRGGPAGHAAGAASGAVAGERQPPTWLQLRRVFVGTPDVSIPLVADPALLLEVPREMLAPPAAAGAAGSNGSVSGSSASGGTVQLRYGLAAPVPLPPGSFCVLALPWLLTSPMALEGGSSGGGSGAAGPAALIRQSGPLKAKLVGGTAVRPGPQQAA
ncbi:hypothetical protein ABPG75_011565 [Micractinium tetrahymenae]